MTFIKRIFEDKADELIHKQFSRFGKGIFKDRALVEIYKDKRFKVKTSFEFANDLVKLVIDNCKGDVGVSGCIVGRDLSKELSLEAVHKKRMGVCKAELKEVVLGKERLKEIYERFKDNFLLLNLECKNCSLKCKQVLPKPGQNELEENFCKASFDIDLGDEFLWEIKDFKHAVIKHDFIVDELIIPDEYKNDLAKARAYAKRKGKIIKRINVDGNNKEIIKEVII